MLSVLVLLPLSAQDEAVIRADEIEVVREAVSAIPGMQAVVDVSIDELNFTGEPATVLTVVYLTAESDPFGYRAEMLDVMHVIAETDVLAKEAIEQVVLIPSLEEDDDMVTDIEIILADTIHIDALVAGEMTRTEFFQVIDITAGGHQAPDNSGNEA